MKRNDILPGFSGAAAVLVLGLVTAGCSGGNSGHALGNHPPAVEITGGPVEQSEASYTVRILWRGWDDDGIILHYEYAIDPPLSFTDDEIAAPEKAPGVSIRVIPGPSAGTDTLRVSKTVGGLVESFDWVQTVEFSRSFAFQTPNPDSIVVGGALQPDNKFSGAHTVFVRCLDNEDTYSSVSHLSFTAFTVTPTSKIENPDITAEILTVGVALSLRWSGLDSDSETADKKPAGYLYKLLRLDTLDPKIPITAVNSPNILYQKGGEWTRIDGDTTSLTLQLVPQGAYVFGLRAVDEAGGIEPNLQFSRNAFKLISLSSGGKPTLTIFEPSVGSFTFRGTGGVCADVEVATGARLRFTWSATAQEYGGQIDAYSWGLDIPDLDLEGPQSGWSLWGPTTGNLVPIVFTRPGVHVLYVRVRDVAGAITLGCITMNVIEFPFDREALYVDDFIDKTFPRAPQHDDFWRRMFQYYADNSDWDVTMFDEFHTFGANDAESFDPSPIPLSQLGRYKTIIWSNLGTGNNGISSLVKTATIHPYLGAYLLAGGKLWLSGGATMMAITTSPNGVNGDPEYPKISIGTGQFCYDFLKIHSTSVNDDKGEKSNHTLVACWPFPGKPVVYDTLTVDTSKMNPVTVGLKRGVSFGDAIFDPIFAESEPGFRGELDSLYVYGASGPLWQGTGSIYQGKLNGLRWHDPDPDRLQGRVQWFGFPIYYFYDTQAREVFKRSIDWFREEQIPVNP
jgi:hypothetical protein